MSQDKPSEHDGNKINAVRLPPDKGVLFEHDCDRSNGADPHVDSAKSNRVSSSTSIGEKYQLPSEHGLQEDHTPDDSPASKQAFSGATSAFNIALHEEGLPFGLDAFLQRCRAPSEKGLRTTQLAILRSLTDSGHLPARNIMDDIAVDSGASGHDILRTLHEHDFVRVDKHGHIIGAYPFSVVPTRHRVELQSGVTIFAMCAIDALGIPPMAHSDATIHSRTESGDEIRVVFRQQRVSWNPQGIVVYIGSESLTGSVAEVCCGHVNFFVSRIAAETWARAHPEIKGTILDQVKALQLGAAIFGKLLED